MSMENYNKEMSEILGIYNCDKFIQLIEDIHELVVLYNVDDNDDWVRDIVGEDNTRNVRLARTAILLSRLADNHHRLLRRIHRVAPGFWQRAEKLTKTLALNDC